MHIVWRLVFFLLIMHLVVLSITVQKSVLIFLYSYLGLCCMDVP